MQIRNVTSGPIFISDMPGGQPGSSLVLEPGVLTTVFDGDAARSTQLNSFITSGAVAKIGTSEPTTGTQVGQTPGGDVTAELAANTSNDATVAAIASAAGAAAAVADGKAVAAQATAAAALPKAGGTMSGTLAMGGQGITGFGTLVSSQGEGVIISTAGSLTPPSSFAQSPEEYGIAIASRDLSSPAIPGAARGMLFVGGVSPSGFGANSFFSGASGKVFGPGVRGGAFIHGGEMTGTSSSVGNGGIVGMFAGSSDFSGGNVFINGGECGGRNGGNLIMTSGDLLGWQSVSSGAPSASVSAGQTLTLVINGESAKTITFHSAITGNAAAVAAQIQALVRALTADAPVNQVAYSGFQSFFLNNHYFLVAQGDQINVTQASLAVTGGTAAAALKLGVANGGSENAPSGSGVGPIIFGLGAGGPYSVQCGQFDASGFQVYGSPMAGHNHDGSFYLVPDSQPGWHIVARSDNNSFQLQQNDRNASAININSNHNDNAFQIEQNKATFNTGTLLVAAQGGSEAQLQLGSGPNPTWTLKQAPDGHFAIQNAGGEVLSIAANAPNNSLIIDSTGGLAALAVNGNATLKGNTSGGSTGSQWEIDTNGNTGFANLGIGYNGALPLPAHFQAPWGLKVGFGGTLVVIEGATGNSALTISPGAPNNALAIDASGNVTSGGNPIGGIGTILTAFFNSQASGGVFVGVPGIPASTDSTNGQFPMPCGGTLKSFSVFAKGNHNFSETVSINRNTGVLASITIPVAAAGGSGGNLYNSGPLNIAISAGDLINFAYSAANGGAQLILSAQIA